MERTGTNSDQIGVKRPREEDAQQYQQQRDWEEELPETKKLRGDLLLEILDDDDDDVVPGEDRIPATVGVDLADVMKSFEEEIGATNKTPREEGHEEIQIQKQQPEMGFLLEASDDELGLPPTATGSVEEEVVGVSGGDGVDVLGQMWAFEDEISSYYDGFGGNGVGRFGGQQEEGNVILGSGLFDDDFSLSWPSDFADFSWRPETLPAV